MELVVKRSTVIAVASIALGIVAALALAELLIRITAPPFAADRVFLFNIASKHSADCYPRAAGVSFPLDLAREPDRQTLASWLGQSVDVVGYSTSQTSELELFEQGLRRGLKGGLDLQTSAELAKSLPLCVTYDREASGPRHLVRSPGAKKTLALLGDSFVFGQGVDAGATFTARLASALKMNVQSYARNGANMPEIELEFGMALREASRSHFSQIAYVYVLNDPYASKELSERQSNPNGLIDVHGERGPTWLTTLNSVSALSRRLTQAAARKTIGTETLRWYSDLHDPEVNPGIERTFERLAQMTREARRHGVDFVVLVYPLMLDLANYPLADVHRQLRELAARNGVALLDLLPAFKAKGRDANLLVHPLDSHPNALAHGIAAEAAAAYLRGRSQ